MGSAKFYVLEHLGAPWVDIAQLPALYQHWHELSTQLAGWTDDLPTSDNIALRKHRQSMNYSRTEARTTVGSDQELLRKSDDNALVHDIYAGGLVF